MMPVQKPGKSRQDFATPREFIAAVEKRFGPISCDLAAHTENHVVDRWLGPGGMHEDSFEFDWSALPGSMLWLNPPFSDIEPWAARCAIYGAKNQFRIAFLVPASIGSEWFAKYVWNQALVLALRPRLSFDGKAPYPKDCMLCVYGSRDKWLELWRWKP